MTTVVILLTTVCGCLHEREFDLLSPTLNYWKQIEFIVLL